MGSWVGDLRSCAIGRGVRESYHRRGAKEAEKHDETIAGPRAISGKQASHTKSAVSRRTPGKGGGTLKRC